MYFYIRKYEEWRSVCSNISLLIPGWTTQVNKIQILVVKIFFSFYFFFNFYQTDCGVKVAISTPAKRT